MRPIILFLLFFASISLSAQQFSRVKILLDENHTLQDLGSLGLEVDHGNYAPFKHFIHEFSSSEIDQIKAAGFKTKVLIADLEAHYVNQNHFPETANFRNDHCDGGDATKYDYPTPVNYTYGSMGGYFTYQEMLDILDDMVAKYPDLITQRAQVGDIVTHEGRPVYWLRVSDNPNMDEPEPEVLYTAVHHAREPNSLSQMIFYLWHLLENYDTDEEVKYLLDNTELYFMPCINPDGYVYNEFTNPDGGGFWRKNRRDNLDGTFGVDLNRNYGYEWGYDNQGSSPITDSQTYRGPSGFSEPETQAVKFLCEAHEFQIALNYHTYGNLLIYPWGFSDMITDEHETFEALAGAMNRENNYFTGTGTQTVGYTVNGDSDDWMYGENITKNAIYAMTPEVGPGSFGFWPPQSEIDEFNKSTLLMNLTTAHLVHNYGLAKDLSPELINETSSELDYSLTKYGLKNGLLTVSIEPVSNNIAWVGSPQNYGLVAYETTENSIPFVLNADIQNNEEVVFNLVVDNGIYAHKEAITKVYSDGTGTGTTEIFGDNADDLSNWSTGTNWGVTPTYFFSAPSSITDSPFGSYNANENNQILLENSIDLVDLESANLSFWASWDIENDYDYVLVQLSVNGGSFTNMCGKYTNLGSEDQIIDEPLYDGLQLDWVKEEIDLGEFVDFSTNPTIDIRFVLISDGFIENEGFFFDDMSIGVVEEGATATKFIPLDNFEYKSQPNPARDFTILKFSDDVSEYDDAKIMIFNALGQQVYETDVAGTELRVSTKNWESGVYFYQLMLNNEVLEAKRLSVAR
ncbi:MAG: M14 family zinc carboxypeptidase [Saprospiraceae bacterium]|jgi:hypothetical protein|nr:M14 family zinc carboxypeptidase [Saprospiraceae bacterium]